MSIQNDLPADSVALALSAKTLTFIAANAVQAAANDAGFKISDLAVDVAPSASGNVHVHATGTVHWKVLKAPAEVNGDLNVAPNGALAIENLELSSSNPLVSGVLKPIQSKVAGFKVSPQQYLPAGFPALADVALDATGGVLRLTGRLAS